MSIIDRFRLVAPRTPSSQTAFGMSARLDPLATPIDGEALRAEIIDHLAQSELALAAHDSAHELLVPGHKPIRFSSRHSLTPNNRLDFYEETTTLLIAYLIERFRPAVFFDIGAGIGYFSRIATSHATCELEVHAFEMRPDRLAQLKANVASDPFGSRVHAHLIGLTDAHKGESDIHYASSILFETTPEAGDYRERWRWLKFNVRGGFNRDFASAKVLMTSLDHFCESRSVRPDLLKIDVDGYEGRVLEGGAGMLRRHKPFVLLELHKDKKLRFGVHRRDIANGLFDLGYKALFLTDHQNRLTCDVVSVSRGDPLIARQETDLILFYHPDYPSVRRAAPAV